MKKSEFKSLMGTFRKMKCPICGSGATFRTEINNRHIIIHDCDYEAQKNKDGMAGRYIFIFYPNNYVRVRFISSCSKFELQNDFIIYNEIKLKGTEVKFELKFRKSSNNIVSNYDEGYGLFNYFRNDEVSKSFTFICDISNNVKEDLEVDEKNKDELEMFRLWLSDIAMSKKNLEMEYDFEEKLKAIFRQIEKLKENSKPSEYIEYVRLPSVQLEEKRNKITEFGIAFFLMLVDILG